MWIYAPKCLADADNINLFSKKTGCSVEPSVEVGE